jgi:hypothetical protein
MYTFPFCLILIPPCLTLLLRPLFMSFINSFCNEL